ncbi:MAG: chemotaxis protein CheW [Syntrophobacteraceae bacterium]
MGLPSLISRTAQTTQEQSEEIIQLVTFRIGEEEFGVDVMMVQEIIRLPVITPIPNSPDFISGMINLRGRIIPIIDLRQRLRIRDTDAPDHGKRTRILIVELYNHLTGFIVDSVSEIAKVPAGQVEPAPHLVVSSINAEYMRGVVKQPGRLIMLLDFGRILRPSEEKAFLEMGMISMPGKESGNKRVLENQPQSPRT